LAHVEGVAVTQDGSAVVIHPDKIPSHNIIVAPDEDQYLVGVSDPC